MGYTSVREAALMYGEDDALCSQTQVDLWPTEVRKTIQGPLDEIDDLEDILQAKRDLQRDEEHDFVRLVARLKQEDEMEGGWDNDDAWATLQGLIDAARRISGKVEAAPRLDGDFEEKEDRCPHGMFYSGAGACPMCGGGAELPEGGGTRTGRDGGRKGDE